MNEITTKELKEMIDKKEDFVLLDCRGVDYYNWEHLPSAINLRWKYVEEKANDILPDKEKTIITSCDGFTCTASIRCYEQLTKLGYKNILEYSGGMGDWKAHGFSTVQYPQFKITDTVYRFPNQTFYDEEVNSYLIVEKDFVLLVDGPQQITEEHEDFILHFHKPIKIFMTHNSTGGESGKLQKKHGAKIHLHKADKNGKWLTVKPDVYVEDGYKFTDHLRVVHTPGHTPGSSVLHHTKRNILFTGDHVQGDNDGSVYNFLSEYNDQVGDRNERLKSAVKLLSLDFTMILPFHYEMIRSNAKQKLSTFIKSKEKYL